MSQPLDRSHQSEALGEIDEQAGEFWVKNPFQMPRLGHNLSAYETNRLFINIEGRDFVDASFASQADIDSDSRSVIAADMNGDHAVDLLVGSVGGGPLRLFSNRITTTNHRVKIELVGVESNRLAVGTRVIVRCGTREVTRDLFPANGFMGQSPLELLIGVGQAAQIDEISIRWPTGKVQRFENLPVDCHLTFTENTDLVGLTNLLMKSIR